MGRSGSGARTTVTDERTKRLCKLGVLTRGVYCGKRGTAHFIVIDGGPVCIGSTRGVDVFFRLPRRDKALCGVLSRVVCGKLGVAGVRSHPVAKGG